MNKINYGVKVPLVVDMVIGGCHGGTAEGYALSQDDGPQLLTVTLVKEPIRDERGNILPYDDVGEELREGDKNEFRASQCAWLWQEAKKPETAEKLREAWSRHVGARREVARARQFEVVR
jgi:hypothetical protein